ncbi:MAG: DUF2946 domain-containing protein [Bordetella sp.]|uniref:DUF2946 domain-containing protein n=1 Tax=Bordetella sp. TaxID=28081 RepID=UPI003F7BF225
MNPLLRSRRTRSRTVWLGLVAMCLVVFAPLISQTLMAARMEQARLQGIEQQLCSADGQGAAAAPLHSGHAGTPDGSMSACGYCNFLAGHAALPAVPPSALAFILLVLVAAVAMPPLRHIAFGIFPCGRPRAPPPFSRLAA